MILVVGERANVDRAHLISSPDEWYYVSMKLGAFRDQDQAWRRLESIGLLRHDESMNLCMPKKNAPLVPWWADQIAAMIRDDDAWHRIVICGRRAAGAFGIDWPARYGHLICGRYVVLPHPSGRNRWWNQPDPMVREMTLRSLIGEQSIRGLCKVCEQPLIDIDEDQLCPVHEEMMT